MKKIYIFLLKFLGMSLVMFIFRHQLLGGYTAVLRGIINITSPNYNSPPDLVGFIYSSSMTMITFAALIFATSIVPMAKRAGFFILGMFLFLSVDWLGVQYMMYPQGRPLLDEDSFLRELYLSSKWILPFLLWFIMSYADIWKFFASANEITESTTEEKTEAQ